MWEKIEFWRVKFEKMETFESQIFFCKLTLPKAVEGLENNERTLIIGPLFLDNQRRHFVTYLTSVCSTNEVNKKGQNEP